MVIWLAREVETGKPAKAVVATEFQDHDLRFGGENVGQALNSVCCSIATDSQVHDVVVVASGVEQTLQIVGVALARRDAEASRQTVAEGHDDGTGIG